MKRSYLLVAAAAVALFVLAAGGAWAVAENDGVINACVGDKGEVRIVASEADCDPRKESHLFWNMIGPKGDQGDTGEQGIQGVQGLAGPAGPQGPQGEVHVEVVGVEGPTGPAGTAGATGAMGPQGPAGPPGPAGIGAFYVGRQEINVTNKLSGQTQSASVQCDPGDQAISGGFRLETESMKGCFILEYSYPGGLVPYDPGWYMAWRNECGATVSGTISVTAVCFDRSS